MDAPFAQFKDYSVCNVADAMIALGLLPCYVDGLNLLSPGQPNDIHTRICGPAHTVKFVSSKERSEPGYKKPYVDSCSSGCVLVLSCPREVINANLGGLIMQRAKQLGVVGAVVDGRVRDLDGKCNILRDNSCRDPRGELCNPSARNKCPWSKAIYCS
jgi:regulator of RNase E activity RraA